jgi:hypothetical protein
LSKCGAFIQKSWDDIKETEGFLSMITTDQKAEMMWMIDVIGDERKVSVK